MWQWTVDNANWFVLAGALGYATIHVGRGWWSMRKRKPPKGHKKLTIPELKRRLKWSTNGHHKKRA